MDAESIRSILHPTVLSPPRDMTSWTTVPLFGPNRWSSRQVLELLASADFKQRSIQARQAVAECLRSFLDRGRFTTTHVQSISVARQAIHSIEQANDFPSLWLATAEWMSAMSGVPTHPLKPLDLRHPSAIATDNSDDSKIASNGLDAEASVLLPMEMEEELLSRRCFELALEMIETFEREDAFPIALKFRELFDYADDVRLGPSSRAILVAAIDRGIPYYRMTNGSLVQLGEGIHQRRIWTAETDATSAIAESIASDKDLTKRLLRNVGVPVPLGRMVTSPEDAWAAAQEVGFPVVVKPRDANHQRGISIELTEREEIQKAYHWAIEGGQTQDVMVEQFALGQHHRLLVVGNRLVAASRGHVETVLGDGVHSIEELVRTLNDDPRRGEAYTDPLGVVQLNAAAQIELSKQGFSIHSIPEPGRRVLISRTGDLTTDCTEEVHPITAQQAVLAARVVGLDVAGLDVLAIDIGKPLAPQRGAVVEVNAGPSLTPHVVPLFGSPQPVGQAIVEMLFPALRGSRVEIIGVLSSSDSKDFDETIETLVASPELSGMCIGYLPDHDILVGENRIELGAMPLRARAQALLGNPAVECLVLRIDPQIFSTQGAPVPRLDRLVISERGAAQWSVGSMHGFWDTLRNALTRQAKLEFGSMPMEWRQSVLKRLSRVRDVEA
jgi:cyanophycin synthetase